MTQSPTKKDIFEIEESSIIRLKWTKEINVVIMECFYLSKPFSENGKPQRGYRQRMHRIWNERGVFPATEQRICDQARAIRKNVWLTDIELESIKQRVLSEEINHGESDLEREEEVGCDMTMNGEMRNENEETVSGRNIQYRKDTQTTEQSEERAEECIRVEGYGELSKDENEIVDRIIEIMKCEEDYKVFTFKRVDRCKINEITAKGNKLVARIQTDNITDTNKLLKAVRSVVAEKIGLKEVVEQTKQKEPWWKRRLDMDIKRLRKYINILERKKRGEIRKEGEYKRLEEK